MFPGEPGFPSDLYSGTFRKSFLQFLSDGSIIFWFGDWRGKEAKIPSCSQAVKGKYHPVSPCRGFTRILQVSTHHPRQIGEEWGSNGGKGEKWPDFGVWVSPLIDGRLLLLPFLGAHLPPHDTPSSGPATRGTGAGIPYTFLCMYSGRNPGSPWAQYLKAGIRLYMLYLVSKRKGADALFHGGLEQILENEE